MKSFRNFTLAATALAIFALATALSNTTPAGAQNVKVDSVKVVNTDGDWAAHVPVQMQGTANIAGNVGITGTPNVNVVNMPGKAARNRTRLSKRVITTWPDAYKN